MFFLKKNCILILPNISINRTFYRSHFGSSHQIFTTRSLVLSACLLISHLPSLPSPYSPSCALWRCSKRSLLSPKASSRSTHRRCTTTSPDVASASPTSCQRLTPCMCWTMQPLSFITL